MQLGALVFPEFDKNAWAQCKLQLKERRTQITCNSRETLRREAKCVEKKSNCYLFVVGPACMPKSLDKNDNYMQKRGNSDTEV